MKSFTLLLLLTAFLMSQPLSGQGENLDRYVTPEGGPVKALDATAAFAKLTDREKQYAHWMSEASWRGAIICFAQVSAESPEILELLMRIYRLPPVELRRAASRSGVSQAELEWLDQYTATFLSNTGNYLSFGDTKFIPRISPEKMQIVVQTAASMMDEWDEALLEIWRSVRMKMYSLEKDERALGLEEKGVSAYYGEDITTKELAAVKAALQEAGVEGWNTRVFKGADGTLEVMVASIEPRTLGIGTFENRAIVLRFGDYSSVLSDVVHAFEMAYLYAANDNQRKMIKAYIAHFRKGDIDLHKDAMRWWVKDAGPAVETNLGFIETYRDPEHVRAEWEGLVAIVNKEQSKKFQSLVDAAPKYIAKLPWPKPFERDSFRRPDFTSLEVLAFANGGIPAGINIPNYDEIRQNFGFKNVSLGNVLKAGGASKERIQFIADADQEIFRKLKDPSFEVQVGLHELLGHGSGKLFMEDEKGALNFDRSTKNPVTGESVASWYKPGQTWGSQFGKIASSWEECRAEAVGIYLCTLPEVMKIFNHEGQEAEDVAYVNWLGMARAGLAALPFFNPDTGNWGQAHMQARYALLQVMLEAGKGFVKVTQNAQGDWVVEMDRNKIESVGHEAVGDFLQKLNVYKATANVAAGKALYSKYTAVDDQMKKIREDALAKRKPRHIWVQPVTDVDATGKVVLRTYPATYRGVIDSFLDRYADLSAN